jgi:hypothetical protein
MEDLVSTLTREEITIGEIPNPPFLNSEKSENKTTTIPEKDDDQIMGSMGHTNLAGDTHRIPEKNISNPAVAKSYTVKQKYQFKCLRCDCDWTDMAEYTIEQAVYNKNKDAKDKESDFWIKTTKTGGTVKGDPLESDEDIVGQ